MDKKELKKTGEFRNGDVSAENCKAMIEIYLEEGLSDFQFSRLVGFYGFSNQTYTVYYFSQEGGRHE